MAGDQAGVHARLGGRDSLTGISVRDRNHHGTSLRSCTDGSSRHGTDGHGNGNSLSGLLPLLFPCHRVVDATGGLHNYFYGLDMKARLLKMEGYRG